MFERTLGTKQNIAVGNMITFTVLCFYTGHKLSANLGYFTIKGEWKMERAEEEHNTLSATIYFPPHPSAAWPLYVFVMVNKVRRYLTTSIHCCNIAQVTIYFPANMKRGIIEAANVAGQLQRL